MVPRTHLVEFQEPVETTDDSGASVITYQMAFTTTVSFRVEQDRLTTEGEIRPSGRLAARIRMPYTDRVTRGWRVIYRGEVYDIETSRDPFGDRKELELLVVAVEQ